MCYGDDYTVVCYGDDYTVVCFAGMNTVVCVCVFCRDGYCSECLCVLQG